MMTSPYMVFSAEGANLLAFGKPIVSVPRTRSSFDNPDFWGGALSWVRDAGNKVGNFLGNVIDEIPPTYTLPGGVGFGISPRLARDVYTNVQEEGILATIGRAAEPIIPALADIGKEVMDWGKDFDPLGAIQDILSPTTAGDLIPDGFGIEQYREGRWPYSRPSDEPETPPVNGDGDGDGGGNGGDGGGGGGGGGNGGGGGGDGGGGGGGAGPDEVITENGDITNVYNYYYDPQASQGVEKASNDGLFGGGGGSIFMIMMMMMTMMPMMQGFGGLQQTIRAEPRQRDVSGLFYG